MKLELRKLNINDIQIPWYSSHFPLCIIHIGISKCGVTSYKMLQLETSYRRQKSVGGTILCIKNKYFKSLRHLIVSKAFIYKCYMTVKAVETGPQRSGWLFSPAVETTVSTPASQIGLSAWHAWLQQRIPMSCYDASRGGAGDGSNAWIPIGHPGDLN